MKHPNPIMPGPRGHWLSGSLPEIMRDRVQFLLDLQRDYGDVARIRLGPFEAVAVFHPEGIQHVLQDNHSNYSKDTRTYATVRNLVGNGLLTSDGDFWLGQRRLMQPAFHQQRLNTLCEMICREAGRILDGWEPHFRTGRSINIANEMNRLALSVATLAMFGSRARDPDGRLFDDIDLLTSDTAFRFEHPFYPPLAVPFPYNRQYKAALKNLDGAIYAMIAERRSNAEQADDLLAMLLDAQDDKNGNRMSDQQLRDEMVTLFIAGHETSAEALSWTLFLLSQHPEAEARLRKEVQEVLGGRRPGLDDLPKLVYTRMVMDESMRLYPPAWLIERKALGDDEIGGYRITKGTTLAITQYVTHRHPQFWEEPERFKPDRFDPQRNEERPHYAFFPFGGGPRMCIGKNLALLEIQLALCLIVQRCRFQLEPGWQVRTKPELSLRLRGGLPMRLEPA